MERSVKLKLIFVSAIASGALRSTPAHADVVTNRCNADLLNVAQAKLRLEWARACGARVNVVSPTAPVFPASAYLTGANDAAGIPLWEYIENDDFWGRNSYSGDSGAGINQIFTQNQWRTGPYIATQAAGGFQKWTESTTLALARPTYPIFGDSADINSATPLFPNPNYSLLDCNFYTNAAGTIPANTSASGFYVNAYCTSNLCGDGVCSSNENALTCARDCAVCGDGICSSGERTTCPSDCGSPCGCPLALDAPGQDASSASITQVPCQSVVMCPLTQ